MPKTTRATDLDRTPTLVHTVVPIASASPAGLSSASEIVIICPPRHEDEIPNSFPRLQQAAFEPSYNPYPRLDYLSLCLPTARNGTYERTKNASVISVSGYGGAGSMLKDCDEELDGTLRPTTRTSPRRKRFRKCMSAIAGTRAGLVRSGVSSSNRFDVLRVEWIEEDDENGFMCEAGGEEGHAEYYGRGMRTSSPVQTHTRDDATARSQVNPGPKKTARGARGRKTG